MDKNNMIKLLRQQKNEEFVKIFQDEYCELVKDFAIKKNLIKDEEDIFIDEIKYMIEEKYPKLSGCMIVFTMLMATDMFEENICELMHMLIDDYSEFKERLESM